MPDPVPVPATCEYMCILGYYVLIGGSAPEGFSCPGSMGPCDIENDIVFGPPQPIDDPSLVDPPVDSDNESIVSTSSVSTNSAIYTYDITSGMLYFSKGKAQAGFGFFPSLNAEQLSSHYPSIAEEVSVLKNMSSMASFKISIPALPASVVGQ
jgi:hypothetical protein